MEVEIQRIMKYLLLLVLILNLVSILVPWGTFNASIFGKVDFYNWGAHINTLNGDNQYTLNVFFLDSNNFNEFFGISDFEIGFIPIIFGILVLLFSVLVIAFTSGLIIKNEFLKKDISAITVCAILSVICFYIYIQFGISSLPVSSMLIFEYSTGFILVIISICIMAFTYFIFDFYATEKQMNKDLELPIDILKMRYIRGEISKEEYQEMKKEIEE